MQVNKNDTAAIA